MAATTPTSIPTIPSDGAPQASSVPESLAIALDDARVAVTRLLSAGRAQRERALDDRDLSDALDSEHAFDGYEVDRHQAESLVTLARARMTAIHAAYERMASGTYGTCSSCGTTIDHERLVAIPETDSCISCANAAPEASSVFASAGT